VAARSLIPRVADIVDDLPALEAVCRAELEAAKREGC
jgi:hypothetical protein